MIIQLEEKVKTKQKENILSKINSIGYKTTEVKTQHGNYFVCIGSKEFDVRLLGSLDGVADVHRVSDSYTLVSKKWKVGHSKINLGDGIAIGGNGLTIMAGPCSIESEDQVVKIVSHLKENGIKIMRGGVFKQIGRASCRERV